MKFPFGTRNAPKELPQDVQFSEEAFTAGESFVFHGSPAPKASMDSKSELFRPGTKAPTSGIYEVHHAGHATPHRVVVLFDEVLPGCVICGNKVRFGLVDSALYFQAHPMFNREM